MKHTYAGLSAVTALAAFTLACGNQETQVVENFFRAVQAKDTTTISSFSVAEFDQEDVKSWKVTSIGEEVRVPAPLADLAVALKAADEAAGKNKKDAGDYFNAHPLEVDKVKPLVENDQPIPANLKKTAEDWKRFSDIDKDLKAKAAEAKQAYDREKRLVIMSTGQSNADALAGDRITKTAMVDVQAGGDSKSYGIELLKYDVAPGGQGANIMSRWLILSVEPK